MEPSEIAELLTIVADTRGLPKLKTIHDKAMAQLEEYAKSLEPEPEPPEAKPEPPRRVAEVGRPGETIHA